MLKPTARFLAHVATTALTLLMVLFAAMIVLLARGPISLAPLNPYLADALNDDEAPIRIAFDDTVLAWDGRNGRLDIRVVAVRVSDAEGRRLASAPQVGVRLRAAALLELRIEPEQLVLIEPKVRVTRNESGAFELGVGGNGDSGQERQDVLASWLRGEWPDFTQTLKRIRVHEAELVVDDRTTGKLWRAPSADLSLQRDQGGLSIAADAKMVIADRPARISVRLRHLGAEDRLTIGLDFKNVEPAILALETGLEVLQPLGALRMGVSGQLDLELDGEMRLQDAAFEFSSGAGILVLPDHYATPLPVAAMAARGHIAGAPETLVMEELAVELARGRLVRFQGELSKTDAGIGIRGTGSLDSGDLQDLETYWPKAFKPNSRRWVVEHVEAARLADVRLQLDVRPGELGQPAARPDMAVLEFSFSDLDCRYWRPMPKLAGARGHGRIDAKTLDINVESGRLEDVAISEGRIRIAHDVPDPKRADIRFLATGATRSMLDILDRKPLELTRNLGIDTTSAGGEGAIRVRLDVPLLKDVPLRDIGYAASVDLSAFRLANAFGAFDLDDGELALEVTRDGIRADGTVTLNRVPMSITWQHDFADSVSHPNRYGMAAIVDDRQRQALGIALAPYLQGESRLELQVAKDRSGRYQVQGMADLAKARLALPQLQWSKSPGAAARAEFRFAAGAEGAIEVQHFRIESAGFVAQGRARAGDADSRVVFDRLRFANHDFGADVTLTPDGASMIVLSGKSLDLRDLRGSGEASGNGTLAAREAGAPRLEIAARLDRLIVSDSFWLQGAEATALREGGRWQQVRAIGRLNGVSSVEIAMAPDGGSHQLLTVSGEDAGGVFAATGFSTGVAGGTMRLELRIPDADEAGEAVTGSLVTDDFRLVRAPVLTKVLTLGSVTGVRDTVGGDGIQFKRLQADFVKTGKVIHLEEAHAAGPALGFTMSGTIDRDREQIDLNGAVVPAYSINSALGGIPLFGRLLVGREGEGVFAVDYRITGSIEDPVVNVNPLSVLAPGVLRRLVELVGGPITVERPDAGQDYLVPRDTHP